MVSETKGYTPSEKELKDYEEKGEGDVEKGKKEIEGNFASGQKILSEDREKLYQSGVKIGEVKKDSNGTLESIEVNINGKDVMLFFNEINGEGEYGASVVTKIVTKNGDEEKVDRKLTRLKPEVARKIFGKVEEQADIMVNYNLDKDLADALSDSILEELKDLEG